MPYNSRQRRRNREHLELLYLAQNKLCASCGRPMYLPWLHPIIENDQYYASIDHLYARHIGGADDLRNRVAMHRRCNSGKNHRPPTGCELIFHALVLERLEIPYHQWFDRRPGPVATLADVWPEGREAVG